ncbi:hypothetical protein C8F01DRAFT_1145634, partial [Mycena amicta]
MYNGESNATAFHRFVREGTAYVDMGRIPMSRQPFYLSYFLTGTAANFYNQVVVPNEREYNLDRFFLGLYEFCFPTDFRMQQRQRLDELQQDDRTVAATVALFSELWNTIGITDSQEKVVKLWNSFNDDIQVEMYRDKLNPEYSTWAEVVRGATHAEIIVNLARPSDSSAHGVYLVDDEMDILDTNKEYDSTLYLGAVILGDDEVLTPFESLVEDSGAIEAIYFDFVLLNGALAQPIGDLRARYAELLLHRAQLYPADRQFEMNRHHFAITRVQRALQMQTLIFQLGMLVCSLPPCNWTRASLTLKNITLWRWVTLSQKSLGMSRQSAAQSVGQTAERMCHLRP